MPDRHMASSLNRQVDRAVGVQLQNLRIFVRLTREEAAAYLKIGNDTLDDIERGDLRPSSELLLKMAKTYEVPPSRVFTIAEGKDESAPDDAS